MSFTTEQADLSHDAAHPHPEGPHQGHPGGCGEVPGPREIAFTELMWQTFADATPTPPSQTVGSSRTQTPDGGEAFDDEPLGPATQARQAAALWAGLHERHAREPDPLLTAFLRTVATLTQGPVIAGPESFPTGWVKHSAANSLSVHLRRALYLLPEPESAELHDTLQPLDSRTAGRPMLSAGLLSPVDIVSALRVDDLAGVYTHLDHFAGWCRERDIRALTATPPAWMLRSQQAALAEQHARALLHQQRRDFHALAQAVDDAMRHLDFEGGQE